jgi:ABC-2 type transport system permease protein
LGKHGPQSFLVAAADLLVVVLAGMWLFDVPFRGSVLVFGLGALLFVFVTLAVGVLISTLSESQGQAIQMAIMVLLPQIMLSGLIFPLDSMATALRWFAQILPLTHFVEISRGVMLRGAPIDTLWEPFIYLALLSAGTMLLATLRFRKDLAPAPKPAPSPPTEVPA